MTSLYSTKIGTNYGKKEIGVYLSDITTFNQEIDILTTSAFLGSYVPTPHTIFHALDGQGISVKQLSTDPLIDLRNPCHTWLSKKIEASNTRIHRIGCVEFIGNYFFLHNTPNAELTTTNPIRAYFAMLDIAAIYDIKMDTIVLPLLGSGRQNISANLIIAPLLNECIAFLKRNSSVKRILFIEKDVPKAHFIANYIRKSYNLFIQSNNLPVYAPHNTMAFISYNSKDKNIADNLCSKLEKNGVQVWYAYCEANRPSLRSKTAVFRF